MSMSISISIICHTDIYISCNYRKKTNEKWARNFMIKVLKNIKGHVDGLP